MKDEIDVVYTFSFIKNKKVLAVVHADNIEYFYGLMLYSNNNLMCIINTETEINPYMLIDNLLGAETHLYNVICD